MSLSSYQIRWFNNLADIPQEDWDALAVPLKTPFLEWEWLNNLETSGSITAETGWLPTHLTVWKGQALVMVNLSSTISGQNWRSGWELGIIPNWWG
jgi:uncharacterized protein